MVCCGWILQFPCLSFDDKHLILFLKCHLDVLHVRFQHVLVKHAGVSAMITVLRKCYWIIGVRHTTKRVKKTGAPCHWCCRLFSANGTLASWENESCCSLHCNWTGSHLTNLLLWPDLQEVLGLVIHMWRGLSSTSWACGVVFHSWNNSSHTWVICLEGSSWGYLLR